MRLGTQSTMLKKIVVWCVLCLLEFSQIFFPGSMLRAGLRVRGGSARGSQMELDHVGWRRAQLCLDVDDVDAQRQASPAIGCWEGLRGPSGPLTGPAADARSR